ncbi:MAG TPA: DUF6468 domain-containing protein [Rhizomicrobium sp.]|nr:DUF6468 domain-containing protein [Rhizomicrobium sp.]
MNFALLVEIVLVVLLSATLGYCAILERRLSQLRKGQDGFKDTIAELNAAITAAGISMRQLNASASGAAGALDDRLTRARSLSDELALLTNSGERIAQRIEKGANAGKSVSSPPVLANRLDALRTAMGNVR